MLCVCPYMSFACDYASACTRDFCEFIRGHMCVCKIQPVQIGHIKSGRHHAGLLHASGMFSAALSTANPSRLLSPEYRTPVGCLYTHSCGNAAGALLAPAGSRSMRACISSERDICHRRSQPRRSRLHRNQLSRLLQLQRR